MSRRSIIVGLCALGLILAVSAVGYAVGHGGAPNQEHAAEARKASLENGYQVAEAAARGQARAEGLKAGLAEGRASGEDDGARRGGGDGDAKAQAELAAQAEAAAEAERLAALEETRERAANCGAPLFVDGYCPTDEEIAVENQAEALCGPGTAAGAAQAAELGIEC